MQDKDAIIEYLRRCYFAVDGLWFVKCEEEFSFDKALDLDEEVWKVMPKIQARKIRELLHINGNTSDDFLRTLSFKMDVEEYVYEVVEREEDHITIVVTRCPWFAILQKTKREALAPKMGGVICPADLQGIANEFDVNIHLFRETKMCEYDEKCKLIFALFALERAG